MTPPRGPGRTRSHPPLRGQGTACKPGLARTGLRPHRPRRVPGPGGGALGEYRLDGFQVFPREPYLQRAEVLLEILPPLGSRDGHDVVPLRHHPRQGQLPGRAPLLPRERSDLLHQLQILLERLTLEAGVVAAEVVLPEISRGADLAGEESAPE